MSDKPSVVYVQVDNLGYGESGIAAVCVRLQIG